jgi:hypothetical protein
MSKRNIVKGMNVSGTLPYSDFKMYYHNGCILIPVGDKHPPAYVGSTVTVSFRHRSRKRLLKGILREDTRGFFYVSYDVQAATLRGLDSMWEGLRAVGRAFGYE